jgi:hypothetical protein
MSLTVLSGEVEERDMEAQKAADERRHVSLSVSYIVSAPGWVFDEDELDPLPAAA